MKYTKAVGYKFDSDGSAIEFAGATIISFLVETHPVFSEIERIAAEARRASYAHKFAFLPPSSYHMTNKVLYNDHSSNREGPSWSSKYPSDIRGEELDAALAGDLLRIAERGEWPRSFCMRPWYVGDNSIKLQPATTKCANDLCRFRDAIAEETGIRWPDHERYIFHISYAYRIVELSAAEEAECAELGIKQGRRLRERFAEFELPGGIFCTFRNMEHFCPYPLKR